jgi:hypothetical protein
MTGEAGLDPREEGLVIRYLVIAAETASTARVAKQ